MRSTRIGSRQILGCVVLLFAASFGHGLDADRFWFPLLDEDGNVRDIMMPDMTFVRRSNAFILGHVLSQCRSLIPSRTVSIELRLRDCRPVVEPKPTLLDGNALLAIYNDPDSAAAKGEFSDTFSHKNMSEILGYVADVSGHVVNINTYSDAKKLQVSVGSPELVNSRTWKRRTYHIPETMTDGMKRLPKQLQPTGPSIAYDPATRLLVVIDRDDSNVFALLNALGYAPAN